MTEITFLGTGSMVPTRERNVQAILLEQKGELLLFDCGEGTQRQMNIAGYSRAKIRQIFITHWHGDHVGGLISLIQTIFNSDYQHTLHIHGPKGSGERLKHLQQAVDFENKVDIEVHEHEPGREERVICHENEEWKVECTPMRHGIPTLAYAFEIKSVRKVDMKRAGSLGLKTGPLIGRLQRGQTVAYKGQEIAPEQVTTLTKAKRFVLIPDTSPNSSITAFAEEADLLVSEATFANEHEEKAEQNKHMTAAQTSLLAQQAGAKRLIITHFSQRYRKIDKLLEEARIHFPNAEAAHDFLRVKL